MAQMKTIISHNPRKASHIISLMTGLALIPFIYSYSFAETLAGRTFNHTIGQDFSFDPPYGDFAGITFNPLTQTWFMTDNVLDSLFEIQANGTLVRTINISGLKRTGIAKTDAEGIAWMYGQTFALALHDGKEIAVTTITPATTSIARAAATIYDISSGPGKPKGLTYVGSEDAFYWVTKDLPKAVIKARINTTTGKLDTLWTKNVDNLPALNLADVAVFPRISPNLLIISESSKTVIEADLTGPTAIFKSALSLLAWPIPKAGGITFGADGKIYLVGKHVASTPEDDFTVFTPALPVANQSPTPIITLRSIP